MSFMRQPRSSGVPIASLRSEAARFALLRYVLPTALALLPAFGSGVAFGAGAASVPNGGQFAAGAGSISATANGLIINQSTTRGIINWQNFSIGQGQSVQIDNGRGATLNRVTGGNISDIAGTLKSTGSVYVINPAGIIVLPGGQVATTGNFFASTRDMSDSSFMAGGAQSFSGNSAGVVTNQGTITSTTGDVTLVGKSVTNSGQITAPGGTVSLAAGDSVLLQPANGDQQILVNAGSGDVTNSGSIAAAQAELTAAGGNVYALASNNGGVIRATGSATKDGHVYLTASGDVSVGGTVTATNANGSGGKISATGGATGGSVSVTGTINANAVSASAKGGTVVATASKVSVGATANISADGGSNGGIVLIGGDRHGGSDPSINLLPTAVSDAQTTAVAAGATISAVGGGLGGTGNGGNVVVWSDQSTSYAGAISARAGAAGGNGGFVEVSGEMLGFAGTVDTRAPKGTTGTLLLDPEDVTIISSTDQSGAPHATTNPGTITGGVFNPTGTGNASAPGNNSSYILNTDLDAALAISNVTINTGTLGDGVTANGNIHFGTSGGTNGSNAAPVFWSSGNSLTLNALGVIDSFGGNPNATTGGANPISPGIMVDALGTGSITFNAGGNGVVAGGTVITIGSSIAAHGGTISLNATSPGYSVVVGNAPTVVSNVDVSPTDPGLIVFHADQVRFGVLFNETGLVTTTGNVIVEPFSAGPVVVGNNNQSPGNSSTVGNTALINPDSIQNVTANTLIIGSAIVTNMLLETPAAVTNFTGINAAVTNLELLTGPNGSVIQDSRTPIAVTTGATTGTEVSANGNLAVVTGGAVYLPDLLNFFSTVAIKQLPGGIGGNIVLQGNTTDDNTGSLNIGTVNGISGISAPGANVTLINVGTTTQDSSPSAAIVAGSLVLEGGAAGNYATYTYFDQGVQTYPTNNPNVVGSGYNGFTGAFTLNNTSNAISRLAGSVGSLSLFDSVPLTTASLSDNLSTPTTISGITAFYGPTPTAAPNLAQTGAVTIVDDGSLTIGNGAPIVTASATATAGFTSNDGPFTSAVGGDVLLEDGSPAAGTISVATGFINDDGTAAFGVTGGGVWRVYSQDPRNDVFGGLTSAQYNFLQYNAPNSYATPFATANAALNAAATGNGFIYTVNPTVSTSLVGTITKVYDGTTAGTPISAANLGPAQGTINGDVVTLSITAGSTTDPYPSRNVGSYTVTVSSGISIASAVDSNGVTIFGYGVTPSASGLGTITPASLVISAVSDTKVYDATTTSSLTPTFTGLQTGDTLTSLSQSFTSPNVMGLNGSTLVVNPGFVLSDGNGGNNYTVTLKSAPGTITPLAVTPVELFGTRPYDGSTDASASLLTITNDLNGPNLTISGTGVLASRNVGTEALLSVGGALEGFTLGGSAAGNYTLVGGSGSVLITPLPITVTAVANTKIFDGTTTAGGTPIITSGSLVGGDTGLFVENYGTVHAGSGLTLTPTGTVNDGDGGNNYTITFIPVSTGIITPEGLTISAVPDTKTYDGTTISTGTPLITVGTLFNGDSLTNLSQAFTSRQVLGTNGSTLVVNPGFVLTDASDYTVTLQNALGTINPALLTVTAVPNTKGFDGTDSAAGTPIITSGQLFATDTGSFTETYSTIHAGTGLTLTPTGTITDGNGGADYIVTYVPLTKNSPGVGPNGPGIITPEALTISAVTDTKTYDGTTVSTGTPLITVGTLFNGDSLTNLSQSFTSKNVLGTNGSTLVVNPGFVLTDASDYTVTLQNALGTINPALLTVSGSRVYDGTTGAAGSILTVNGEIAGDPALTVSGSGSLASANVGNENISSLGTLVLTGTGSGNYTIESGTVNITPLAVTLSGTRTYDGTTGAAGTILAVNGEIPGDPALTVSGIGTLASANAGSEAIVSLGSLTLTGAGAGNYTIGTGAVDVTPLAVTLSGTRTYNGTTGAPGTILTVNGEIAGDPALTVSGSGTLASANAGNETISSLGTLTLTGTGSGNYTIGTGAVDITPLAVTLSGTRTYNGTTGAAGAILTVDGEIPGDPALTVSGNGTLASANAGNETISSLGSLTLTGAGSGNYTIGTGAVDITPLAVTVTGTRTYNGTTGAAGTILAVNGEIPGDPTLTVSGSGTLASANAGDENISSLGSLTLTGTGSGNYTIGTGAVDITPLAVTVTGTRTYNGTAGAAGTILTVKGEIAGDPTLTVSGNGTLVSGNAGNENISSLGTLALTGTGSGNYTIGTGAVDITPLAVILSGTRPFNGSTDAPGSILTIVNDLDDGKLTISGLGTLLSPDVGDESILSFGTLKLGGSAAGNYTFVGGRGTVLVTPLPAVPPIGTRRDQTVAGVGVDPYIDVGAMGDMLMTEPGQNGLAACIPDSWYRDPTSDDQIKVLCRPRARDFRGLIIGMISSVDVSGYLIRARAGDVIPPPDTAQRRQALYHQLRNK